LVIEAAGTSAAAVGFDKLGKVGDSTTASRFSAVVAAFLDSCAASRRDVAQRGGRLKSAVDARDTALPKLGCLQCWTSTL